MPTPKAALIGLAAAILLGLVGGGLLLPELLLILIAVFLLSIGMVGLVRPRMVGMPSRLIAAAVAGLSLPCLGFAMDSGGGRADLGPFVLTLWVFAVGAVASIRFLRRKASDTPVRHRSNEARAEWRGEDQEVVPRGGIEPPTP
jgi:hypothetical protein